MTEDVLDLIERLRKGIEYATCGYNNFPLTNEANVTMREAADALDFISFQLAVKDSALLLAKEQWEWVIEILGESKARAETAEAENERLRAAIIKAVDPSSVGICGIESAEDGMAYMAGVLLPALGIGEDTSKEGKK